MPDELSDRELLDQAVCGERAALDALFDRHRDRLVRVVALRLDRRVQGRLDPSDVIQESLVEAYRRIEECPRDQGVPFFVWLRFLTVQKLAELHRRHLGATRNAGRDVALEARGLQSDTSAMLAVELSDKLTTPSQATIRAELKLQIIEALSRIRPLDREVLALRHFEQLSNREAALVIGISETAACNRYVRALQRLKRALADISPGWAESE